MYCMYSGSITVWSQVQYVLYVQWQHHCLVTGTVCTVCTVAASLFGHRYSMYCMYSGSITVWSQVQYVLYVQWQHHCLVTGTVCTVCTVAASLSPHCSHIDWQSMQICVRVWSYANCPLVDYSVRVCLRTGHCSYIYVFTYVSPHVDQERSI